MASADDNRRLKGKIIRLLVSIGMLCLAVGGASALVGASPSVAIVVGGGVGCSIAYCMSRLFGLSGHERDGSNDQSIAGPKWFALWFVTLCALHFAVGLAWVESLCCVAALVGFFMATERYNRARAARR